MFLPHVHDIKIHLFLSSQKKKFFFYFFIIFFSPTKKKHGSRRFFGRNREVFFWPRAWKLFWQFLHKVIVHKKNWSCQLLFTPKFWGSKNEKSKFWSKMVFFWSFDLHSKFCSRNKSCDQEIVFAVFTHICTSGKNFEVTNFFWQDFGDQKMKTKKMGNKKWQKNPFFFTNVLTNTMWVLQSGNWVKILFGSFVLAWIPLVHLLLQNGYILKKNHILWSGSFQANKCTVVFIFCT